jgi:hypothetical protein
MKKLLVDPNSNDSIFFGDESGKVYLNTLRNKKFKVLIKKKVYDAEIHDVAEVYHDHGHKHEYTVPELMVIVPCEILGKNLIPSREILKKRIIIRLYEGLNAL